MRRALSCSLAGCRVFIGLHTCRMVCTRPPPLGERSGTMRVALVVPGGVDRSGEYRVIPALLALLRRLGRVHDVQVFALRQETEPAQWQLEGVRIHNIGSRFTRMRAVGA